MKKSNIIGLSLLLGTSLVQAEHHSGHGDSNGIASDRSSYKLESQILHIPYVTLDDEGKTSFSLDMKFNGTNADGDFLFLLDQKSGLHEIHAPHFSYEGSQGPKKWAGLTTDFSACGVGKSQSPIDISTTGAIGADLTDIAFNYTTSALNVLNNGHTIQVNYDAGSSITVNGASYNLAQLHFHTPSEHKIDGESFPIEMHLVHISEEGGLAVVGVLFKEGAENEALAGIVDAIPPSKSDVKTIEGKSIDANALLPSETLEYRYSGSLTTPPCSEGVKWLVLKNPLELSADQLADFKDVLGTNNRPVQSLNAREILLNSK